MKHLIYGLKYLTQYWLLGVKSPLICGLVLHNKCNLRCKHCFIVDRPNASMSFDEAVNVMDSFYSNGGRCLYLEGGEPFIWKDNSYTMEDVVGYANRKGYYAVIIYTNGLKPIESNANTIFVSIDGLHETHDYLRGKSFDRIMNNIHQSRHASIYINYTINTVNKSDIEYFCEYVAKIPQIKGTFFYLHTPYYGYDDLNLDGSTKKNVLQNLLKLKRSMKF